MADSKVRPPPPLLPSSAPPLKESRHNDTSNIRPFDPQLHAGSGPSQLGPELRSSSPFFSLLSSFFSLPSWASPLQSVLSRMDAVEKRLAAEQTQLDGPVGGADLREYQTQLLLKLRAIRGASQRPTEEAWTLSVLTPLVAAARHDAARGLEPGAAAPGARRGPQRARRPAEAGGQAPLPRAAPQAARARAVARGHAALGPYPCLSQ
ncbi:hypothetical protein ON010_g10275 [Phytophthora cinnamomi]|nr:hypothetical protein ON010_g10275 [Phytophthora cinnamomi]